MFIFNELTNSPLNFSGTIILPSLIVQPGLVKGLFVGLEAI